LGGLLCTKITVLDLLLGGQLLQHRHLLLLVLLLQRLLDQVLELELLFVGRWVGHKLFQVGRLPVLVQAQELCLAILPLVLLDEEADCDV